jgi:hypothetical protein
MDGALVDARARTEQRNINQRKGVSRYKVPANSLSGNQLIRE